MCEKQRSIPKLEMPTETQLGQIVIMHSDEKMVNVKEMGEERIIFEPVYFRKGYQNATPNCYMRYRVFQKLQAAVQALEEEDCLKIFDAWRPYRLQMELYLEFYEKVRQQYAEESEEQIRSRVRQFVSIPSQDRNRP